MSRKQSSLPAVRVIKGIPGDTIRDRLNHANEAVCEGAGKTLATIFGLLPVFAMFGLMVALAWAFAMFQSP